MDLSPRRSPSTMCWVLAGVLVVLGCDRAVTGDPEAASGQPQQSERLSEGCDYVLQADAFCRVYEGAASLHGPNSLWCEFGVEEFRSGRVTNQYIRGIVAKGTRIRLGRAVINDLGTHTVILHYGMIEDGPYAGTKVLINPLMDDLPAWLKAP